MARRATGAHVEAQAVAEPSQRDLEVVDELLLSFESRVLRGGESAESSNKIESHGLGSFGAVCDVVGPNHASAVFPQRASYYRRAALLVVVRSSLLSGCDS